jgi:hypothetical protein
LNFIIMNNPKRLYTPLIMGFDLGIIFIHNL